MDLKPLPLLLLGSCAIAVSGCGEGSRGVELLTPPPDQMQISEYQPENPYVQTEAGPLSRPAFSTKAGGYAIEVRDILVGPGQKASDVAMTGAGVFEVREGGGTVTIGEQAREVAAGATFAVSEGEKLQIEARGGPMILRAYLFKAQ
jgi:hypothetical protein